ncbi:MAG: hypothetical protein R3C32_06755 [Chloroflexota bacterium]
MLSELRKGDRAHPGVRAWFAAASEEDVHTSVLVLGEIRRGIESIRRRDVPSALALEQWLTRLATSFGDRVLTIDARVADRWARWGLDRSPRWTGPRGDRPRPRHDARDPECARRRDHRGSRARSHR